LQEVGSFNDVSKKVKELESELSTTKTTFSDLSKKYHENIIDLIDIH
jgi:5-bromo-4-chloroindolyl phosphate hydrolysis protein